MQISKCEITAVNTGREKRKCSCKQCAVVPYVNYEVPNVKVNPHDPLSLPKHISDVIIYTSLQIKCLIFSTIIVALTFIYKCCSNKQSFHDEIHVFFLFFPVRLRFFINFETCISFHLNLLLILFLEPLDSPHGRHPYN